MARSKKSSDKTTGSDDTKATKPEGEVEDAVVISETGPEAGSQAVSPTKEPAADTAETTGGPADDSASEDLPEMADYVGDDAPDAKDEAEAEVKGEDAEGIDTETLPEAEAAAPDAPTEDETADAEAADGEKPADPDADDDAQDDPQDGELAAAAADADSDGGADKDEAAEVETPADETLPVPAPATQSEPPRRSPVLVFAAMVLGGAVAAGIGYAVAISLNPEVPVEDPGMDPETAALLSQQAERIAALESGSASAITIEAVESAVAPFAETVEGFDARLSGLETTITGLDGRLDSLADRLETIAMRPESTGIDPAEFDQAITEFRQQLESAIQNAQVEIDEARREAERISEEAFNSEQSAMARAAWREVVTALESGAAYGGPLAEVAPMLDGPVPEPLAANAESGLPTLADLQARFPEAARAAIADATREDVGDGAVDRLTSFFKVQTGFRSLEPREGDDADAVLSRAEADLRGGDLAAALAEVEALDGPAADAMAGWAEAARTRIAALDAAADISARLLE